MISPETRAEIRRHFYAEHWKIGTIASELGVHPTHQTHEGVTYDNPRQHTISLMCDDLVATMADLEAKGARFTGQVEQEDYGFTVMLNVPGADEIMLYEPRHPIAHGL